MVQLILFFLFWRLSRKINVSFSFPLAHQTGFNEEDKVVPWVSHRLPAVSSFDIILMQLNGASSVPLLWLHVDKPAAPSKECCNKELSSSQKAKGSVGAIIPSPLVREEMEGQSKVSIVQLQLQPHLNMDYVIICHVIPHCCSSLIRSWFKPSRCPDS